MPGRAITPWSAAAQEVARDSDGGDADRGVEPRPADDLRHSREENWTLNGPLLDSLHLHRRPRARQDGGSPAPPRGRQVPLYRADMSPPEIASVIESFYRIARVRCAFRNDRSQATNLQPSRLPARFRSSRFSEIERRGRVVGAIIGDRLYLVLLEGTRMHYFRRRLCRSSSGSSKARR